MAIKGDKFKLFGTDNIVEITAEDDPYWIVKISSGESEQEVCVRFLKQDLADSVNARSLIPT